MKNDLFEKEILVSIALATYNGERFLKEQIESLLNQTYKNIEIVISDDKSTDKTLEILNYYLQKDERIKFSINQNPSGFQKNFEKAIEQCCGEIIFLCDQDDVWYENKIEEHLSIYRNTNYKWVCNKVRIISKDNKNLGGLDDFYTNYYSNIKILNQIGGRCIIGCSTSYIAKYIKNIWPISKYAPSHDSYIQLNIRPHKTYLIEKVLQDYRQHENNVFGINKKESNNINGNIEKSIKYTKDLYMRRGGSIIKRCVFLILFILKKIKYEIKKNV